MNNLTVSKLKKKAQLNGVKVKGKGWKVCCPPDGKKADIIKALKSKSNSPRYPEKRRATPQKKKKRRIPLTTNTNTNTNMGDWSRDQCLLKCGRFMGTQSEKSNPFAETSSPGLTKGQQRYKESLDRLEEKYGSNQENDDNPEWEIAELKAQLLDPDITEEDREAIEDQIEYIQEEIDDDLDSSDESEDESLVGGGGWGKHETKRLNQLHRRMNRLNGHY